MIRLQSLLNERKSLYVFDFDDRIVKQVMVPQNRVIAIDVELGRNEVTKRVIEEGFSRLPIYLGDIDNIIGIVHSKDLLKAIIDNKFRTLKEIMRPVHFIPESMKINELLRDFQKHHYQMAIVTNEFGSTAGLVTMEDIIEEFGICNKFEDGMYSICMSDDESRLYIEVDKFEDLVKEIEDGDDNKVYELVSKLEDKYELFI